MWFLLRNIRITGQDSKKLEWVNEKYKVIRIIGIYVIKFNMLKSIHFIFYINLIKHAVIDLLFN